MAMDELLLQYKLENSKKAEKVNTEQDLDSKRPALSDLLKEEDSPIAIVESNSK
jgi:hypothetical protein